MTLESGNLKPDLKNSPGTPG